jgi:hypothetical protein
MKKNKYIAIAVVVVCLLATVVGAVKLCRYYLPQEGPTCALFERYKDNPYVKACLLGDFRVNDTLTTDALLLEAATDSAWCTIMVDFGVPEEFIELYISNKDNFINDERNSICEFYRDKNNMKKFLPLDNPDSRIVIGFHAKKTMCIFMTDNPDLKDIISFNEIKKMKKHEKED